MTAKNKTDKTEPRTYRLLSSSLICTPGILRWAMNGYKFRKDRKALLRVFTEGFQGPIAPPADVFDRLLKGEIKYTVEDEDDKNGGTVVFTA
jgi:hypothetical protein